MWEKSKLVCFAIRKTHFYDVTADTIYIYKSLITIKSNCQPLHYYAKSLKQKKSAGNMDLETLFLKFIGSTLAKLTDYPELGVTHIYSNDTRVCYLIKCCLHVYKFTSQEIRDVQRTL